MIELIAIFIIIAIIIDIFEWEKMAQNSIKKLKFQTNCETQYKQHLKYSNPIMSSNTSGTDRFSEQRKKEEQWSTGHAGEPRTQFLCKSKTTPKPIGKGGVGSTSTERKSTHKGTAVVDSRKLEAGTAVLQTTPHELAEAVREEREHASMTQIDLNKAARLPAGTVAKLESRAPNYFPTGKEMQALEKALKKPAGTFSKLLPKKKVSEEVL